jgi:hypothetical protein
MYNRVIVSIVDLRNEFKLDKSNSQWDKTLESNLKEFVRNGRYFERDFNPSRSRVYYWTEADRKSYELICKDLKANNYKKLGPEGRAALSQLLNCVELGMMSGKTDIVQVSDNGVLPGVSSSIVGGTLRLCRIEGTNSQQSLSIVSDGEVRQVAELGVGRFAVVLDVEQMSDYQYIELLASELDSAVGKMKMIETHTDRLGAVWKIKDVVKDDVTSVAAFKDLGFLYVVNGKLCREGKVSPLEFSKLYQVGEQLLYVKSLGDSVITLSKMGRLRSLSATAKNGVIAENVYWTNLENSSDGVVLKYMQFGQNKVNEIKL